MLRIAIPSTGQSQITFNNFENFDVPAPPNGIDAEINNDALLLFDDEEQAIDYAENLNDIAYAIDDDANTQKIAITDIVNAIFNNDFIKTYRDSD